MKQELRTTQDISVENRSVKGYAVVFDSESVDLGFREVIKKGAITEDLIKRCDIFAKFNHDDDKVLARSKYGEGSLKLELDAVGLHYEFEAPHTAAGDELLEHINRGEIDGSSFAFSVGDGVDAEKWWKDADGVIHRDVNMIGGLYDISPVYQPAYQATTCASYRFEEIKNTSKEVDSMMNLLEEEINKL